MRAELHGSGLAGWLAGLMHVSVQGSCACVHLHISDIQEPMSRNPRCMRVGLHLTGTLQTHSLKLPSWLCTDFKRTGTLADASIASLDPSVNVRLLT